MSEFVSRTVVGVVGVSRDPVNANFGVSVADGVEETGWFARWSNDWVS